MSKIDELIQELCPEGVKRVALGEIVKYEQPTKYLVTSTDYDNKHSTPVLTAGQTFLLGFTDETEGVYPASVLNPVIIFDDFTTAFKWVDFPFKAKSSAMKMLTSIDSSKASLRFIFFVLQAIQYVPQDHARQWIGTYSSFTVPLPPLDIQNEIVKALNSFTELEAVLEAELEARRKQYHFYRDLVFSFPEKGEVRWMPMGEVADVNWGDTKTTKSAYLPEGEFGYSAYSAAGMDGNLDHYDYDRSAIVLSAIGALAGKTWLAKGKWSCIKNTIRIFSLDESFVTTEFLYWISSRPNFWPLRGSAQPFISKGDADKILIPIPNMKNQIEICSILSDFSMLLNESNSGLPAEISARRKQYEYYRDKLLTFKELTA